MRKIISKYLKKACYCEERSDVAIAKSLNMNGITTSNSANAPCNDINFICHLIILLSAIILSVFAQNAFAEQLQLRSISDMEDVQIDMRGYNAIEIPAGTFIPVMNAQEISTQYCSEGYKVKFIVTDDMYMHDTNVIPKETAIYGYVEKIHDPVVGTNASMQIRVSKLVYTDGVEIPIKGYLYNANGNVFGGGLSEPVKYVKMPHRQLKMGIYPTLQIKPSYERKMGTHTTISAGSNEMVVLTAPAEITHTLTN